MIGTKLLNKIKTVGDTRSPVVRILPADLETPVSTYLKLAGQSASFLLESVTGGEQVARYSFIGVNPRRVYVVRGNTLEEHGPSGVNICRVEDPLRALADVLEPVRREPLPGLPRFCGGLVGYLGYEMMRFFEPKVALQPQAELPDAIFLWVETLVAFDHAYGRLLLIANPDPALKPDETRHEAENRLDELQALLDAPLPEEIKTPPAPEINSGLESNMTREHYFEIVNQAKEYIAAGDIFQVVLSQRLSRETGAGSFAIYRTLRRLNPSPYMFYFDFKNYAGDEPLQLIGASPEMHVRLEGRNAFIRPIAGTRPRGQTDADDLQLEKELLADPKERAEHVMLVDLARNDLGRVCDYGSVRVKEQMRVERYSHVMHMVSMVEGQLRTPYDAFDLMRATFPAGTVSGAPKIRAMQIIAELEKQPRGVYAGAVGYFGVDGSMDTCIAIRTMVKRGRRISIQAGGGIVADSEPEREFQESLNKARALAAAVEMAEKE